MCIPVQVLERLNSVTIKRAHPTASFAVQSDLVKRVEQPNCVTIIMHLPLVHCRYMTISSVYAPTMCHGEDTSTAFY